MKYYIKKYFRDTFTSIVLIFSIAVTIFCSLNVARQMKAYNEKQSETEREYLASASFTLSNTGGIEESGKYDSIQEEVAIVKSNQCNIYSEGYLFMQEGMKQIIAELIYCANEELPYNYIEGDGTYENDEPTIFIGKDLLEKTYKENGKRYINIGGYKFFVGAVIDSTSALDYNEKAVFFYDNLVANIGAKNVEGLFASHNYISIASNISNENVNRTISSIKEKLEDDCELTIVEKDDGGYIYVSKTLGGYISKAANILCILNVIIIINIWIKRKYKEFAIRKAFGSSDISIVLKLIRQFVGYFILSFGVGIFIQYIYSVIRNKTFKFSYFFGQSESKIYIYIFAILIIEILANIVYIRKIETKKALYCN